MKSWEFNAVTYEASVYCNSCLPEGISIDSDEVFPVFADSEWDYYPTCAICFHRHDYVGLTEDGVDYEAQYSEPDTEDIVIYSCGSLGGSTGVGVVDGSSADDAFFGSAFSSEDEALDAIRLYIDQYGYYPQIWRESDHGNYVRISLDA